MTDPRITRCECHPEQFPFECPRHRCVKSELRYKVCRIDPEAFELWEQGNWLGQTPLGVGVPAPTLFQKAWNLAESLAAFVADGCHTVPGEEYARRLGICDTCDKRQDGVCSACGCYLVFKAKGRAFTCPLNKWPAVEEKPMSDTS